LSENEATHLPSHEAHGFNDGRLNDLFAREDTPSHGVWSIGMSVGTQIAFLVDHVVSDVTVSFDLLQKQRE